MKILIFLVLWCLLLVLYWPAAIVALLLFPLVWVVSLPFRFVAMVVNAVFSFLGAVLFLPARLLGGGKKR